MNRFVLVACLLAFFTLSACVDGSAVQGGCLEHRQGDFGNQTYWGSCPPRTSDSPWRGPTAGR